MSDIRRVLIVDDSPTVCRMVEKLFRQCGFIEIESVNDGAAALDRLRKSPFEIVICDWHMEPITGLNVLRDIRARQETRAISFILMSAKNDPVWVGDARSAGADCLLAKPFDAAKLRAKIAQLSHGGRSGGLRERVLAS
jgi:two-component system, chemotaxis family, chemotaxis protein CheY